MADSDLSSENRESRNYVRALARGLQVIECFDETNAELTLSDVAKRTGLTRPSARRALLTLQTLGYASSDGNRFTLTARTLRLGYAYLSSKPLWRLVEPHIRQVGREIGQSCSIAVLDGDEIVFVVRVAAKRIINDYIAIGFRLPAYATSLGRVLLASLRPAKVDAYLERTTLVKFTPHTIVQRSKLRKIIDEARQRGWAYSDQQLDLGMRSIAVPIHDSAGRTIAAINTNALVQSIDMETLEREYLPPLRRAADTVSLMVAWRGRGTRPV